MFVVDLILSISKVLKGGRMSKQSEDMKKQWGITGVAILAGLFIGMGYGYLVGNLTAGIFLGLGGGFLAMMIAMLVLQIRR